jgi:class 3 adenylate cyclase
LFADISGYTALCEAVASKGAGGDEYLARHLNSYFEQLVRIMSSQGGDVFKFAGDGQTKQTGGAHGGKEKCRDE